MRPIKFRGLAKDGWCYGDLQHDFDGDGFKASRGSIVIRHQSLTGHHFYDEVDPATVGQFSGVKDKKGRDIYEGDLMLVRRQAEGPCEEVLVMVRFDDHAAQFVSHILREPSFHHAISDTAYHYEVIGSIHEPIKLTNSRISSSDGDGGIDGEAEGSYWEVLKERWEPLGFTVEISGDHIIARLKNG